MEKSTQFDEIK